MNFWLRYALNTTVALLLLLPLKGAADGTTPVESTQFGATRFDFLVGDTPGFVIVPPHLEPGTSYPWLWYAPTFISHLPDPSHTWMFTQFLEAGFFIAGVEVGESYGSPRGTAQYQAFYEHIVKTYGLSPKATLMPQSRGGLMLYNWAATHPESVACVAGIYTVCNLKSYPALGKAAPAYEMTEQELAANLAKYNPIDRVAPLVAAEVPIFHIHGDSDTVVPIEDNAGQLVKRYKAAGGEATIKVIPGKGHEVCDEFFKDGDLVRFVLKHDKGEQVRE